MTTINISKIELTVNCFRNNKNITSVDCNYTPWKNNSLYYSGGLFSYYYAFDNCINLTTVTNINNNVTNMYGAFYNCRNLTSSPIIPDNVSTLACTFFNCNKLTEAPIIPNNVKSLAYTFNGCSNITDAPIIPNGVTTMAGTFQNCVNLINITPIPISVTNMINTYWNCFNLVNVPEIPDNVTNMWGTFRRCWNITKAPEIPNNVTDITTTFTGCSNITQAPIIPESVRYMAGTFDLCNKLTGDIFIKSKIVSRINTGIQQLGADIFNGTSLEKNVYIPFTYENGVNTKTYNTFINGNYSTSTRKNGAILKDLATYRHDRLVILQEANPSTETSSLTFYSDDLETIENGDLLSDGSYKATFGNGVYVALKRGSSDSDSLSNTGYYSTDGKHWTEITLPVRGYWNCIAYGAGKFVAISYKTPTIIYSSDGIHWSYVDLTGMVSYLTWVAFGSTHFVAVDGMTNSKYIISTDGENWSLGGTLSGRLDYITYNPIRNEFRGSRFVSTDDGITWSSAPALSGSTNGIYPFGSNYVQCIRNSYNIGIYMAEFGYWVNMSLPIKADSYVTISNNSGVFLSNENEIYVMDDIENFNGHKVTIEDATQINTLIFGKVPLD